MVRRFALLLFSCILASSSLAQELAPPVPERLVLHSKILNEDRVIWVRMPAAARPEMKENFAVLYLIDGGSNINEIGATIDFLADNNQMPPLIVVGIANTDRNRDLTPTHAGVKHSDGSIEPIPTSGGAEKFLDFIQTELVPEITKRYPTHPYRIITGHSLGGLFAVHALVSRPELFNACIATSPSLWWDDLYTVRFARSFLAKQKEFKRTLFFALGNESGDIKDSFEQMQKMLLIRRPKHFAIKSEHFLDETHRTTELLGHYKGLRFIFSGWPVPIDPVTDRPLRGLAGVEQHYRAWSERLGFPVSAERGINSLGYALLRAKKIEEAVRAFQRNVELYPQSPNVYDSLADALEAEGKTELALQNVQQAIDIGTKSGDPLLPEFKKHGERLKDVTKRH